MSTTHNDSEEQPRFSFGSMALTDEPGRQPVSESRLLATHPDDLTAGNIDALDSLRMLSLNERFSPEILPSQGETVGLVRSLVNQQIDLVDEEEDQNVDAHSFQLQLKRMEIDRINYLLRDYFRVRIQKIEGCILYIFKDSGTYDHLSEAEQKFAVGYMDLVDEHFKKSFLHMLPHKVQVLDKDGNTDPSAGPNLDQFVFCRVKNSVGSYAVGEEANDETLDLEKGDIVCIRYRSIQQLLLDENVELI